MGKKVFIAEKPSVAAEFAKALHVTGNKGNGYLETGDVIVTWCVGHLITMSYPEAYDPELKKWSMDTLPFLPKQFRYQVIDGVRKQYRIVSDILLRKDVDTIYVCTDSGREGEYIYRLVEQMAGVKGKKRLRVWIDSQTEEEIMRGIREAKDLSEYDNLAASAYLRAKEDYLMGINFSRVLTLKYGNAVASFLKEKRAVVSVGRVMTCVLGMVVRREREIRAFEKTPFYRVVGYFGMPSDDSFPAEGEWRAVKGSAVFEHPRLYKENGWKKRKDAEELVRFLSKDPMTAEIVSLQKKKELKNPPLLYNLAELQNDCSKMFKISPDETLKIVQELYERKLVTYPRTDARVLSTAVSKEIWKNLKGLTGYDKCREYAAEILDGEKYHGLAKTRYVNDKQITDHYAIIPTGQGIGGLKSLPSLSVSVYELIARRFLSIFYPPAVYEKLSLEFVKQGEHFFSNARVLEEEGYLKVSSVKNDEKQGRQDDTGARLLKIFDSLRKGQMVTLKSLEIKEGETSPPKRYTSGSMILAMENAGQLIEDEDLREQIRGSGIGTSATRAEILKKLCNIKYLSLAKKTQVITPTLMGEMIFDVVSASIRPLLNPELTASWEKGLNYVAEGSITSDEYMQKLERFVTLRTNQVKQGNYVSMLLPYFEEASKFYRPLPAEVRKTGKRAYKRKSDKV